MAVHLSEQAADGPEEGEGSRSRLRQVFRYLNPGLRAEICEDKGVANGRSSGTVYPEPRVESKPRERAKETVVEKGWYGMVGRKS